MSGDQDREYLCSELCASPGDCRKLSSGFLWFGALEIVVSRNAAAAVDPEKGVSAGKAAKLVVVQLLFGVCEIQVMDPVLLNFEAAVARDVGLMEAMQCVFSRRMLEFPARSTVFDNVRIVIVCD